MTTGCTVVTPLVPDAAAVVRLLADIDPALRVLANHEDRCLEVLHPERDAVLLVVEEARSVRVPGEVERLLGSTLGFAASALEHPDGLYWLDVHLGEQSADAERLLVLFSLNLAERGHGSYVEHNAGQVAFPASTNDLDAADLPGQPPYAAGGPQPAGEQAVRPRPADDEPLRGNRWN